MIEFNPDTHEYKVDGKVKLFVTEIIPKQKFYCDYWTLENARLEGKENHELIKMYYDTGETFDNEYLIDYDSMVAEDITQFGILNKYESPLYSSTYDFVGTPDVIYSEAIIDIKRSYNRRYQALQLAGYAILAKDNGLGEITKWYIAWHDGVKFRLKDIYDPEAIEVFIALRKEKDLRLIIDDYFSKSFRNVDKLYK